MKKSIIYITTTLLIMLGIFLDLSRGIPPVEQANAFEPTAYEFSLSKEVLLSHTLIGLEQNPYRSISFKELKNGNIEVEITFDASISDELLEEYAATDTEIPDPEVFTYEISTIKKESDAFIHLISEDESIWLVFESNGNGFIYDQIGYDYMIVRN